MKVKISYSTNWMGPVSNQWYEEQNIPYVLKMTSGVFAPAIEYKYFTESYSCGRIDIRGLDEEEYYCGQDEYGVDPMHTEDWNALSEWLDDFKSDKLIPYETLISLFEDNYCKKIRWANY